FKGELLTGSNAVFCTDCGKKSPTRLQISMTKLPRLLCIHLQRFKMDYTGDVIQMLKDNNKVAFPMTIDMFPFTAEGMAERERLKRCGLDADSGHLSRVDRYTLVGALIHSGT